MTFADGFLGSKKERQFQTKGLVTFTTFGFGWGLTNSRISAEFVRLELIALFATMIRASGHWVGFVS